MIGLIKLSSINLIEDCFGIIHILRSIVWGRVGVKSHHRVNITKQRNIWGVGVQRTSILMLRNIWVISKALIIKGFDNKRL